MATICIGFYMLNPMFSSTEIFPHLALINRDQILLIFYTAE